MTTGALIFAINNGTIDYEAMAHWSAKNIQRHLGIPTHIVTDRDIGIQAEDSRWFSDFGTNLSWHNKSRVDAYRLSPWDRTLLLDADYVVASDQLRQILSIDQDIAAHRWAYDITGGSDFQDQNVFGSYQMPMWWATVIMFRRSRAAELMFDSMSMIRENWDHYRRIYHNSKNTFRNDHALSIALGIINGHCLDHAQIPWGLASLLPQHTLVRTDIDTYRVEYESNQRRHWISMHGQDFHAMGKRCLGEIIADTR